MTPNLSYERTFQGRLAPFGSPPVSNVRPLTEVFMSGSIGKLRWLPAAAQVKR